MLNGECGDCTFYNKNMTANMLRAKVIHPNWPEDPFRALSVISEELGELAMAISIMVYQKMLRVRLLML